MAWLGLSLLGPREARESQGILCSETAASGTRLCGPGRGGDQAGSRRGGQAGPFVIAAVYSGKDAEDDERTFPRAWRSPSLRSGLPDSPWLLIQPRADDPRGAGGMPSSPWGSVLPAGSCPLCSRPAGPALTSLREAWPGLPPVNSLTPRVQAGLSY